MIDTPLMAASYHVHCSPNGGSARVRRRFETEVPVAVVVSAHGFGHAARSCAVIQALAKIRRDLHFHILTTVPRWFFTDSLTAPFTMHRLKTDVGLVQRTPLEEDLPATVRRLDGFLTGGSGVLERLTDRISRLRCRLVISDIAPLGVAAAIKLGIPGVLVENFTWDWIYNRYEPPNRALNRHGSALADFVAGAELHIQTKPTCSRSPGAVEVPPVARAALNHPGLVRRRLGVGEGGPMVLLTMGGIGWDYRALTSLVRHPKAIFVVPGGGTEPARNGRLIVLPFRSDFYHPDLVRAADVVVGKLGYSTVAETWQAGSAMAYIGRPRFPESPVLAAFVRRTMDSVEISEEGFNDGSWLAAIDPLLDAPRKVRRKTDGAQRAARAILDRFDALLR